MVDHVILFKKSNFDKNGILKDSHYKVHVAYGDNADFIAEKGLYNAYRYFLDKLKKREKSDDVNEKAVLIENKCKDSHRYAYVIFKEFSKYEPEGKLYTDWYGFTKLEYLVLPTNKIVMEDGFVKVDEDVHKKFLEYGMRNIKSNQ